MCGLKQGGSTTRPTGTASHPIGMCGLKHKNGFCLGSAFKSHPIGMCGLKLLFSATKSIRDKSHPIGMCGLKLCNRSVSWWQFSVTSHRDVWIETSQYRTSSTGPQSHPIGMCGLKPGIPPTSPRRYTSHPIGMCGLKRLRELDTVRIREVTSHRDVWIETQR